MKYASVCSGVEAASLAWMPLGWEPVWFSEIEPFPCEVLAQRFPGVPNLGDMTKIEGERYRGTIDIIVGELHVRDSASRERKAASKTPEAGSALPIADFLKLCAPDGSYGKMCLAYSVQTEERTSRLSSGKLMKSGILAHGECWTLDTCEWTDSLVPYLKEGGVCSLSDILETGGIPPRYYLSPTACSGILRRAERRGKPLPPVLKAALIRQSQSGCGAENREGARELSSEMT